MLIGTQIRTGKFNPSDYHEEKLVHHVFGQLAVQGGEKGSLIHKAFLSHFTRKDSAIVLGKFKVDVDKITMTDSRKGMITLRAQQWYEGRLADPRLNAMQSADDFYSYIGKVTNNTVAVRVPLY